MKILVGLGNPGSTYENQRHNIGFKAVETIAEHFAASNWKRRFQGMAAEAEIGRERCLLLKPSTYMNESGRSVGEAIRFYKLSPADVIVFHDELDLEPGKIRVKFGGGHAGHNGLKSISAHIGNDYQRVRIGIGHPGSREAVTHYVLHDFSRKDRDWLAPLLAGIAGGAAHLIAGQDAKFLNEIARHIRPAPAPGKHAAKEPAAAPIATAVMEVAAAARTLLPEPARESMSAAAFDPSPAAKMEPVVVANAPEQLKPELAPAPERPAPEPETMAAPEPETVAAPERPAPEPETVAAPERPASEPETVAAPERPTPKPQPAPTPQPEPRPVSPLAEAVERQPRGAGKTSLGAKLRAWFSRR